MTDLQTPRKSLSLTGITSNARTLLAPAASAWILLSTQCALGAAASDIFCGVLLALIISTVAALAHARLASAFPATGNAYFYVLDSFARRATPSHAFRFVLSAGSALYYFLLPALILATTTLLATYLVNALFRDPMSTSPAAIGLFTFAFCLVYSIIITFIASRGVAGSSPINVAINVIQISALLLFCAITFIFRLHNNPDPAPIETNHQYFPTALDILRPHTVTGVLLQTFLALVLFTGFESTATAAPRSPHKINRTLLIILLIQGAFCYLLQYFAIESTFTWKFGIEDASKSLAPLAELMKIIGIPFFGTLSGARYFMLFQAFTVFLVLIGIALASLTNAARVAYANRYSLSPTSALWALGAISAAIACFILFDPTCLLYAFLLTSLGLLLLYLAIALASLRQK